MNNVLKAFFSGLSKNEKKILYVACGFLCLAIFDRVVFAPIVNEGAAFEEKIDSQTILIQKNLLILQYKDKILGEDNLYSTFFTKKNLKREELIANFLSEVEELAQASTVALTNINPVNVEEKKGYIQYSLTVECTGNMKDILSFMYGIESAQKPIRVAAYEITPKDRNAYDVNCTMTILKIVVIPEGGFVSESEGEVS